MRVALGLMVALLGGILIPSVAAVGVAPDWEINGSGKVERVVDGDTFVAVPVGRVRLADVNAPEVGDPGAPEATAYLTSLVDGRIVYLDVDDVHGTDPYGRTVAVVYVRHNATHLMNVNWALLAARVAQVADYPNEFNPSLWSP